MRLRTIAVGLLSLLTSVLLATSFESHLVGVRARVHRPPTVVKHVLGEPGITQGQVDAITQAASGLTGCIQADAEPPIEVPVHTCVWWVIRLEVTNTFFGTGTAMQNVVVRDRFSAELNGQPLGNAPVAVEVLTHSRGQSHQEPFETQVRITWCVTGSLVADGCDGRGALLPGESAFLDMLVWTKLSPAGKQEYTSAGSYELNSGATAKWLDQTGVQCGPLAECPSTPPIDVIAFAPPAPTPLATGTVDPPDATPTPFSSPTATAISTLTATATPSPSATPTATATSTPTPTAAGATVTPVDTPTPTPTPAATQTPAPTSAATLTPTPTAAHGRRQQVVLNEILPGGADAGGGLLQFVELKNVSGSTVLLNGWSLRNENDSWPIKGCVKVVPGSYVVLVLSGTPPPAPVGVPVVVLTKKNGRLDPTGDRLELRDPHDVAVDVVSWGDATSVLNPPPLPAPGVGRSLARTPDGIDTDSAADFALQAPSPGVSNDPGSAAAPLSGAVTASPGCILGPAAATDDTLSRPAAAPKPTPEAAATAAAP